MKPTIKKPKNGHFTVYCYECRHWTFKQERGCAILGVCEAIKDMPTEQDAYDKPCGLWRRRERER